MAIQIITSTVLQGIDVIVAFFKLKYLLASSFGLIAYTSVITNLFTMFLDIGITAIHYQNKSKIDFTSYFGSYFCLKMILLLCNYALSFVYLIFSQDDPFTKSLILITIFATILSSLTSIFTVNLQVRVKFFKMQVPGFILRIISDLAAISVILIYAGGSIVEQQTITWLVMIPLLVNLINLIVIVLLNLSEQIFSRPKKALMKEYLVNARPLIIQSVTSVINTYLGLVLLANAFGNSNLAYYYIVQNYVIAFLLTISVSSTSLFDSLFPKMLYEKKAKEVSEICNTFEKYASIFYIFCIVFVFLYADKLFQTILPGYLVSVPFLKWMIFTPYFDGVLRPYWGILVEGKKNKLSATICIANIFASLFLEIILIPNQLFGIKMFGMGGWGFVIITWSLTIEQLVVFRILAKKYFGIKSYGFKILIHPLIGISSFFVVFVLNMFFFEPLLGHNILAFFAISSLTLLACYVGGLVITKELTKQDYSFLKELITPSTYIKSFKNELK